MTRTQRDEVSEQLLTRLIHKTGRTLGALVSTTQALQNGGDQDSTFRDEMLRQMEFEMTELQRLLENVTQFKAIEKGTFFSNRRPILPGPWLRQVMDRWQRLHTEKGLTWSIKIPKFLPPILVDTDKFEQSLKNLLANAVRLAAVGSRLSLVAATDEEWLWVCVIGDQFALKQEEYDKVFDLFFTGEAEGRFPVSTGLGLHVTRQLVQQEGGELEAIRPTGENGSGGFSLRVPLAENASRRVSLGITRPTGLLPSGRPCSQT